MLASVLIVGSTASDVDRGINGPMVLFVGTTVMLIVGSTASDVDRGINRPVVLFVGTTVMLIVGSMACDVDRGINGQECCSREQRTNDNVD